MAFRLSVVLLCSALAGSAELDASCDARDTKVWSTMSERRLVLRSDDGVKLYLTTKLAATPAQRSEGFQNICSDWISVWGVLFVFPSSQRAMFHMRNVEGDLDIAFIGEDGRVLEVKTMKREDSVTKGRMYGVGQPYRYALETAAGRLSQLALKERNWQLILDEY